MRRVVVLFVALMCGVSAMAQGDARWWITRLDATLGERYAMHITVAMGSEEPLQGLFMVDGDDYYIRLGVMEVYGDGELRYEINNERKEVTIDRVDLESVDLLTNPTRAFSFVDEEFATELISSDSEGATLRLTPRDESLGIDSIELRLSRNKDSVLPSVVAYNYGGDGVSIALDAQPWSVEALPQWDKQAYRAYDIVSFL